MKQLIRIAILALFFTGTAQAQGYPERPVTLLVPWAPGGPTDLALRALAEATVLPNSQRMLVENKPGASGALAAQFMAQSNKNDGYTLAQLPLGVFRLPYMVDTTFNPIRDITWIINIAGYEFATNVRADSPWKTWAEFTAYAKANPGKVTYGHSGVGTSPNLVMEDLGDKLGIQWLGVSYKGSAPSVTALRGNQIIAHAGGPPWQFVQSGEIRPLVMWGPDRSPKAPNVPTLKELYGIVANSPWGIGSAAGLDPKIEKILHDSFRKAMDSPRFLKVLDAVNMHVYYMSGKPYLDWARKAYVDEKAVVDRMKARQ